MSKKDSNLAFCLRRHQFWFHSCVNYLQPGLFMCCLKIAPPSNPKFLRP